MGRTLLSVRSQSIDVFQIQAGNCFRGPGLHSHMVHAFMGQRRCLDAIHGICLRHCNLNGSGLLYLHLR